MKKPPTPERRAFDARRKRRLERLARRRQLKRQRSLEEREPIRGPHIVVHRPDDRPSPILDYYRSRTSPSSIRVKSGEKIVITFPPVFSFIDNAEATLATLDEITAASRWGTNEIILDHRRCTQLDHGAVSVVAALATEAQRRRVLVNGRNPQDPMATEIIWAVGTPRVLQYARTAIPPTFVSFPLRHVKRFRRTRAETSSAHERVANEVREHICQCVAKFGFSLTGASQRRLFGLLGEVCGNAEEHPGRPDWWVSAYLRHESGAQGMCYLTIFTLGETIHETLDGSLPDGCVMRQRIEELVRTHSVGGFLRPSHWTVGNLWTLYALQEGVHRQNHDGDPKGRGNGTVQLMKYFEELSADTSGGDMSRMCLVSGNTQILFDGTYWPREMDVDGERATVMAFNTVNDLRVPPDRRYVRKLDKFFPGTILSLRLYLSVDHLHRSSETNETR